MPLDVLGLRSLILRKRWRQMAPEPQHVLTGPLGVDSNFQNKPPYEVKSYSREQPARSGEIRASREVKAVFLSHTLKKSFNLDS